MTQATISAAPTSATRLSGRRLLAARAAWLVVAVLTLVLFAAGVPAQVARLATPCAAARCASGQLGAASIQALHGLGLSLGFYAGYALTLNLVFVLVYGAIAALIFWRRSDDWMALFVSLTLLTFGPVTFTGVTNAFAAAHPAWWLPAAVLDLLGSTLFVLFVFLFPDGHFVPGWTKWVALAWVLEAVPGIVLQDGLATYSSWWTAVGVTVWVVALGTVVYAQVYRYRRVASPMQRLQVKWAVLGITGAAIGLLVGVVLLDIVNPLPTSPSAMAAVLATDALVYAALLLIPISMAVATLRYHLFDVDLLINRALVYGMLTVCIAGVYALIVGALGTLLQSRGNFVVSLLAAGVVAVLFHPLHEHLQQGVNRLLYGQRGEPYEVISRMTQRFEGTQAPELMLPTAAETVAEALKLPYVGIALKEGSQLSLAASVGTLTSDPLHLPLVYQSETLGELLVAPRRPDESWTAAERRLLDDLTRHVGIAAYAVRLNAELRRSNAHLRTARQRLVSAREEERRRLRRDLHDGLGPSLAAFTLKLGAARRQLSRDAAAAEALLQEMSGDIETTVADIRRLVYDLRPPTLDELGLVGAVRERAAQYALENTWNGNDGHDETLRVTVEAPEHMPPLPAAVEVAAYRIAQEALTNTARHAHATSCHIRITLDDMLQLEVVDDGVGLAAERKPGVGRNAMRERAAELGGTCTVEARADGGTRVLARLPLDKEG